MDPSGEYVAHSRPLMIPQTTRLTQTQKRDGVDQKYKSESSVRGLCWRGGLAVRASDDEKQFITTLRHELLHALVDVIPGIKEEMYGDDPASQREETVVHIACDHFDKLLSLSDLKMQVEKRTVVGEKQKNSHSRPWTAEQLWVSSLKMKGQEMVAESIQYLDAQSPETNEFRANIEKEVRFHVQNI